MTIRKFSPLALLAAVLSCACSGDDSADTTDVGAGTEDVISASCEATFEWLQKDAYKDTAGRSSELWPPHTTTTLAVACKGSTVASAFQANHGTEPGQKDANGDVILVNTKSARVTGSKSRLTALVDAYKVCSCDGEGGTQFLSLDSIKDEATQGLIDKLAGYTEANLTCSGERSSSDLAALLRAGNLNEFLAGLEGCQFPAGTTFSGGFDEATTQLIADAKEALAGYHVCNNDAALQAKLIETYQQSGQVAPCTPSDDICKGPRWLYTP